MDRIRILLLSFLLLIYFISMQVHANRCVYAKKPSAQTTVWKDKGDDVTLKCPGYDTETTQTYSVEFAWYQQEFDCNGMDQSRIVAQFSDYFEAKNKVRYPDRMAIDGASGKLTIRNLTSEDEQTLTCLFTRSVEYVATVDLKVKDFQHPILTGLSSPFTEKEVKYGVCKVPEMKPTQGFIKVKYNDEIISSKNLVGELHSVAIQITGEAKDDGGNITCIAVQNISGTTTQLSTSVEINVLYSYHTKVMSSLHKQPMEFSNVTLRCEVTRKGNPAKVSEYTWLKDGHNIMSPGQRMILRNVTEDDTGSYKCLITNKMNISTTSDEAQELQLDVVPLMCLPQLGFNRENIQLSSTALAVSWRILYPSGCQNHHADDEIVIQVDAENKKYEFHTDVLVSECHATINKRFDVDQNHEVCLVLKNYSENKFCEMSKGIDEIIVDSSMSPASIAGYSALGCALLAIVGIICIVKFRGCKKRQNENSPIYEGHYEDLEQKHPQGSARSCESTNRCEDGVLPGLSQIDLSIPTPPPLPDIKNMPGCRPIELNSEAYLPYKNHAAIMANITRKSCFPIEETETLGNLLMYCKDRYGLCQDKLEVKAGTVAPNEYENMEGDTTNMTEIKDLYNNSDILPKVSGQVSHHEASHLQGGLTHILEGTIDSYSVCPLPAKTDGASEDIQEKLASSKEQISSGIYTDMMG